MTTRVIFVGMHNKPGKMPLCSTTKSGKLLDRIIAGLAGDGRGLKPSIQVSKTNLYDVEYYPKGVSEKNSLAGDWIKRVLPDKQDLIILLGREVHDNFPLEGNKFFTIIKLAHPASKRSHTEMDKYVEDSVLKIAARWVKLMSNIYFGHNT